MLLTFLDPTTCPSPIPNTTMSTMFSGITSIGCLTTTTEVEAKSTKTTDKTSATQGGHGAIEVTTTTTTATTTDTTTPLVSKTVHLISTSTKPSSSRDPSASKVGTRTTGCGIGGCDVITVTSSSSSSSNDFSILTAKSAYVTDRATAISSVESLIPMGHTVTSLEKFLSSDEHDPEFPRTSQGQWNGVPLSPGKPLATGKDLTEDATTPISPAQPLVSRTPGPNVQNLSDNATSPVLPGGIPDLADQTMPQNGIPGHVFPGGGEGGYRITLPNNVNDLLNLIKVTLPANVDVPSEMPSLDDLQMSESELRCPSFNSFKQFIF